MIEYMVSETNRVFKVITHKDSFIFYHDALSFMVDRKMMKEKGYKEMSIIPEINLFPSETSLKRYRGCLRGNGPDLCNPDSCQK